MTLRLAALSARGHRRHALHTGERDWPETNCYVDLWIELLHALGHDPHAALGFTVGIDFEGDQFTFFKHPPEDLRVLHGIKVQELAIYDSVEVHCAEQLRLGRLPLVEIDAHFLPDTAGTSYRREHVKTTVAVVELDPAARRMGYFHNAGAFELAGDDYDGALRLAPALRDHPDILFPYVEFAKRVAPPLEGAGLRDASLAALAAHLARRPADNPLRRFRDAFPAHLERLADRPMAYFHAYAFNTLRQLGASFELLGSHLAWLAAQGVESPDPVGPACRRIAANAKALQFQLARGVHRGRFGDFSALLDALEGDWEVALGGLARRFR